MSVFSSQLASVSCNIESFYFTEASQGCEAHANQLLINSTALAYKKLILHIGASSKAKFNLPRTIVLSSSLTQDNQVRGQASGVGKSALDVAVTYVWYLYHDTIERFQIK